MRILHTVSLILLALGCNSITYGMQTASRASIQKFSRSCSYIMNTKQFDTQEGRKQAFQEWCPTPIDWNKNIATIKTQTSQMPTGPQEDKMAFYKQCGNQQK